MEKKDEQFWGKFGGTVRKALNNCPLTPEQAQKELESLKKEDALPYTDDEIRRSIEKVLLGDLEPEEIEPDLSWMGPIDTSAIESDALVLNRNRGDEDPETDAEVDIKRKEALNEKKHDGKNEPGLENRKTVPPKR